MVIYIGNAISNQFKFLLSSKEIVKSLFINVLLGISKFVKVQNIPVLMVSGVRFIASLDPENAVT